MTKTEQKAFAIEILSALEGALKEFGTYSFDDKGAHEVMELNSFTTRLKALPIKDAGEILKLVGEGRSDGRSEELRDTLVGNMDNASWSDEEFEELLAISGAEC
jgi:hypothetical protein